MTNCIDRCWGIVGATALALLASTPAEAQLPAYSQPYVPPQQSQPAYRPGQTRTMPAGATGRSSGTTYASQAAAQYAPPARTSGNVAPAFQSSAAPQYRVASATQPYGQPAAPANVDRYAGPYGQTSAPPQLQQQAATPVASAPLGAPTTDRYAAAYSQVGAPMQPPVNRPTATSAQSAAGAGFVTPNMPGAPQYTAMAYGNNTFSFQADDVTADSPASSVPATPNQFSDADAAAAAIDGDSYASPSWETTTPAAEGNCQASPTAAGAAGTCNFGYGANSFNYSTYDCAYGSGGHFKDGPKAGHVAYASAGPAPSVWFGGVYGLLMDRSGGPSLDLAFASAGLAAGDFPASSDVVLGTGNVDLDYQGGIEFRLGRAIGGPIGPGGGGLGVEGVYWTLFTQDQFAQYIDGAGSRTYSMIDLPGLEFDPDGAGALPYRPIAHYWDSALPVGDSTAGGAFDDIEVRVARARSQFELHNVEINLLQLVGLAGAAGIGGDCDTGAYATESCGGSRFSCGKFVGFRFLRLDESFMYGVDFENTVTNDTGFLNHNIRAENDLYGFQLGCNNTYRLGSRWGLHCNAMFGLYGNDIDVRQSLDSPVGGDVRFISTTDPFAVAANESEVSTVGELRIGASYRYGVNCRVFGGWRLLGVTGVALAADQLHSAYIDPAQASRVQSDGSVLMHGMQAGIEWGY